MNVNTNEVGILHAEEIDNTWYNILLKESIRQHFWQHIDELLVSTFPSCSSDRNLNKNLL